MFPINVHIKKVVVEHLHFPKKKKKDKIRVFFELVIDNQTHNTLTGREIMVTLEAGQKVRIRVKPVDRKGKPVDVDSIVFATDNEGVRIEDVEKGVADVFSNDVEFVTGTTVSATIDARRGEGENIIVASIAIEVKPREATGVEIEAGAVEEVEETPPIEPQL